MSRRRHSPSSQGAALPHRVCIIAALLTAASVSVADPKVYSPIVKSGKLELEYRGNLRFDDSDDEDGAMRHVFEVAYTPNDWWYTSYVARFDEPGRGTLDYTSSAWENIFQLTPHGAFWLDVGAYAEYKLQNDEPDELELKLLLEKASGPLVNTLNLVFEKEMGESEPGFEFGYAWRSKYYTKYGFQVGLEAFGDLGPIDNFLPGGRQEHRLGPVIYGSTSMGAKRELEYSLGYLVGVSDAAPDGTLRWTLEHEWY